MIETIIGGFCITLIFIVSIAVLFIDYYWERVINLIEMVIGYKRDVDIKEVINTLKVRIEHIQCYVKRIDGRVKYMESEMKKRWGDNPKELNLKFEGAEFEFEKEKED